jgi:protein involved in polysaccharide export with SLBB domain
MPRILVVSIALALAGACDSIPDTKYPTTPPVAVEDQTTLGVGDVFELTVYNGSKETKALFTLDSIGKISVQYIGAVIAVNKKPIELQDEIQTRLADGYLVDPIVAVRVTEVNSRQLSISGEVAKDGKIKYTPGMTIVDAIAQSGGFTPMAKKNHVKVIRRELEGTEVTYRIPVGAIQDGKRPNFYVAPDDRVFVPERIW